MDGVLQINSGLRLTPLLGVYQSNYEENFKNIQPLVIFIGINNNNDGMIAIFETRVRFPLNMSAGFGVIMQSKKIIVTSFMNF